MIQNFASDFAAQMDISLSGISVVDGADVGCLDVYLIILEAGSQRVSMLVYQSELDDLHNCSPVNRLEARIRDALSRLRVMMEP